MGYEKGRGNWGSYPGVASFDGYLESMDYSLSLIMSAGGTGGFLASVRAIGVEQPPAMKVSAEETLLGGAGGSFFSWGGATKPGSSLPSPAKANPAIIVTANVGMLYFMIHSSCLGLHNYPFTLLMCCHGTLDTSF